MYFLGFLLKSVNEDMHENKGLSFTGGLSTLSYVLSAFFF